MTARTAFVAALLAAGSASGQLLTTERWASGLSRPVFGTIAPGDRARLFIAEQRGCGGVASRADIRILNVETGGVAPTPFLTINGVATGGEQGLLGLAFSPGYASDGYFYVNYTDASGDTQIVRYHVSANPTIADPASATPVLTVPQPFANHNGGWIGFGPDGYLYIALGDGGSGCDPQENAQDLNSLLGKMLRIDVSTLPYQIPPTNPFVGQPSHREEVWAYGLRNPWRNSFDRATGELYIADVGQSVQEEINVQPPATGGRNYGWNCREGLVCSNTAPSNCTLPAVCPSCVLASSIDPVWVYPHSSGCSVTGGYVYRGAAMPWLRGTYFFADYCSNHIWSVVYHGQPIASVIDRTSELEVQGRSIGQVSSFAEDFWGELYLLDQGGGEVYKIVPRCLANCDGSTTPPVLNVDDMVCFVNRYSAGDRYANCDRSRGPQPVNIRDFLCFQQLYSQGCP